MKESAKVSLIENLNLDPQSKEAKTLVTKLNACLCTEFEISHSDFNFIYTRGTTESNWLMIDTTVRSFVAVTRKISHIILSSTEHKSTKECVENLKRGGSLTDTLLPISKENISLGTTDITSLNRFIKPTTCLIAITAASIETGVMNDLYAAAKVAKDCKVPFYSDMTYFFGKSKITGGLLDAFSVDFSHIGGPSGIGVLIVRKTLIEGYKMKDTLLGANSNPEFIAGVAGALSAFVEIERVKRNKFKAELSRRLPCFHAFEYYRPGVPSIDGGITPPIIEAVTTLRPDVNAAIESGKPVIFWIGPSSNDITLPGVISFSVVNMTAKKLEACLEVCGIIIDNKGVYQDKKGNNVLTWMNIDKRLHDVIRVIFSSFENAESLIEALCEILV